MKPTCRTAVLLSSVLTLPFAAAAQGPKVDYTSDIQPILRASCYSCHQGEKAAANLHLDVKASATSAKVLTPGKRKDSELVKRLLATDSRVRMPMGISPLAPEKIALIQAWIDQGAAWPDDTQTARHWAYTKPVRPAVPKVTDSSWVRNPIDAFVLSRLEKEGMKPSPEASKETLIRRVTLDLTGLPPTPQEVDQFTADRSPEAYEKLVDRLLASPHYGERWAAPWLDLARYADTNGFEADRSRVVWKYRDWVIAALNRDMPFDQFTIEQIAGDMLPQATQEQLIATGFNRNTMFNEEGGVDRADFHWQFLGDRVNTTATVWLGSTLGCAQCHDHKFDPFTQKDYYRFLAFFNNSDTGSDEDGGFVEAKLDLPSPDQDVKRKKLKTEIHDLEQKLKTATPELEREQMEWERSVVAAANNWQTLTPSAIKSVAGSTLTLKPDGAVLVSGVNPRLESYQVDARTRVAGITGIRLEAIPDRSLPRNGPGRDAYGNFFLTAFDVEAAPASAPDKFEKITFQEMVADNGKINEKNWQKAGQLWTVDASREDERLPRQMVFISNKPFGSGETVLRIRLGQESEFAGQGIGHFRLSITSAPDPTTIVTVSHKLRGLLAIAPASRTEAQKKDMAEYFRSTTPSLKQARLRLVDAKKELEELGIASTLVMRDRPSFERPSTHLRVRGSFLSKGELVYANVPAILPPLSEDALPNRLGWRDGWLAKRIPSPRAWPLIARGNNYLDEALWRRRRISARRERGPRTRSYSTGWPSSSWTTVGV